METSLEEITLPALRELRVAHGAIRGVKVLLAEIRLGGWRGYGEIGFNPLTAADLPGKVRQWRECQAMAGVFFGGKLTLGLIRAFLLALRSRGITPEVRLAYEMALLDLLGKRESLPVWRLLGLEPPGRIAIPRTVGVGETFQPEPARIVKLKLGGPDEDAKLELAMAGGARLILDMNQGWTRRKAEAWRPLFEAPHVLAVEDPIAVESPADLDIARSLVPEGKLFLDEPIRDCATYSRLRRKIPAVNVKLLKTGGWFAAESMVRHQRRAGRAPMLGCFVESSLSIAYALHFASLFGIHDLDGCDFVRDPFTGLGRSGDALWLDSGSPGIGAGP